MISSILATKGGSVITASVQMSVRDAARLLTERGIGAVVVLDGAGQPCGILSERDIVRACAREGSLALDRDVGTLMTAHLVTVTPATTITEALTLMTDKRIRHLPVLESGQLVGVVSIGDLVKSRIDAAVLEADSL
ncbi:MAG: CBS domain-containing protein, partial [Hyphomonadaceae bacterium]|nr:CBS domain-containing protein [Hyphomonadaceae bacterium]